MLEVLDQDRLTQLKALLCVLADAIDAQPNPRDLSQLSRQYRETLKEIEEIEGTGDDGDEIGEILAAREAAGEPGAVRKNRTGI